MFTPTGPLHPPSESPHAKRAALRPRAWIGLRSLLTAGLVLLAIGGLSATVGAAYAAAAPTVSKIKPNTGPGTGGTSVNHLRHRFHRSHRGQVRLDRSRQLRGELLDVDQGQVAGGRRHCRCDRHRRRPNQRHRPE